MCGIFYHPSLEVHSIDAILKKYVTIPYGLRHKTPFEWSRCAGLGTVTKRTQLQQSYLAQRHSSDNCRKPLNPLCCKWCGRIVFVSMCSRSLLQYRSVRTARGGHSGYLNSKYESARILMIIGCISYHCNNNNHCISDVRWVHRRREHHCNVMDSNTIYA